MKYQLFTRLILPKGWIFFLKKKITDRQVLWGMWWCPRTQTFYFQSIQIHTLSLQIEENFVYLGSSLIIFLASFQLVVKLIYPKIINLAVKIFQKLSIILSVKKNQALFSRDMSIKQNFKYEHYQQDIRSKSFAQTNLNPTQTNYSTPKLSEKKKQQCFAYIKTRHHGKFLILNSKRKQTSVVSSSSLWNISLLFLQRFSLWSSNIFSFSSLSNSSAISHL